MEKLNLDSIVYNASGPRCTSLTELKQIDKSGNRIVLSKSATLKSREGNPKPRYYDNNQGSINSMGLPNHGIDYYLQQIPKINNPFFISISGMDLQENVNILQKIFDCDKKPKGIEINLSCPNIIGKGQLAYSFNELENYLTEIFKFRFKELKIIVGLKLPPYFEINHFEIVGNILNKYPIDFITCVNSIGNGLIVDHTNNSTHIRPKGGCGGIGGTYLKPTGLSNVWNFYKVLKKLNSNIKIIGCGGIKSGVDAYEYILCGAYMVQVGTEFYKDTDCLNRIQIELKNLMKWKKYKSYDDFRGKLQII